MSLNLYSIYDPSNLCLSPINKKKIIKSSDVTVRYVSDELFAFVITVQQLKVGFFVISISFYYFCFFLLQFLQ